MATLNVSYPVTKVVALGGGAGYHWTATGLPAGLAIDGSTGVIGGTPATTTGSPLQVQVTVTDSYALTAATSSMLKS